MTARHRPDPSPRREARRPAEGAARRPRPDARRPSSTTEAHGSLREQEQLLRDLGVTDFSTDYRRLRRQMDADDFSSQQASQALIRAMLGMYIHALPRIERNLRESGGKSVYSAVAAVDCIRNLVHDMRQFGDQSALIERLRREVLQPTLASGATDVVARITTLRGEVHKDLRPADAARVERRLRQLQTDLRECFGDAERRGHELLQRSLEG